jgi:hypothetical protein
MFRNWRRGKTTSVDADVLRTAASEMNEYLSQPPELKPALIDMKAYKGNSLEESKIHEGADPGEQEVLFYRKDQEDLRNTVRDLKRGSYPEEVELPDSWLAPYLPHVLNQVSGESSENGFVKSNQVENLDTKNAGYALSYLEETELIDSWGSDTNGVYSVEADKPEIYDFWRQLANGGN